MSAILRHMMWS